MEQYQMANFDIGNRQKVVDKRAGRGTTTNPVTSDASMKDISTMRARLTVIGASTNTAARLNTMTENDMLYAIRMSDDATGIK